MSILPKLSEFYPSYPPEETIVSKELPIKLCVDCKFYSRLSGCEYYIAECTHKQSTEINLVNGVHYYKRCGDVRDSESMCGNNAIWFEQKEYRSSKIKSYISGIISKINTHFKS